MKDAAYNQRLYILYILYIYKFNYVVFATANDGESLGYRFKSRDDLKSFVWTKPPDSVTIGHRDAK